MRRVILGLTGSVATTLYEKLITQLQEIGPVDVILTERARHFIHLPRLCNILENGKGENVYCPVVESLYPRVEISYSLYDKKKHI